MTKLKKIYEVTITLEYPEDKFGDLCADLQEIHTLFKDNLLGIEINKEQIIDHDAPKKKDKAMLL